MIELYVMLVLFGSKNATTTAEFSSKETCLAAREQILKELDEQRWSRSWTFISCVKK